MKAKVTVTIEEGFLSKMVEAALNKALASVDYELQSVISDEVHSIVQQEMVKELRKAARLAIKEQLCKVK